LVDVHQGESDTTAFLLEMISMSSGVHLRAIGARLSQTVIPFAAAVIGSVVTLHFSSQEEQVVKIGSAVAVNTQSIEDLRVMVTNKLVVSLADARPSPYTAELIQNDTSSAINHLLGGIDDEATDEDASYLDARREVHELEHKVKGDGELGQAGADTGNEVKALEVIKPVSNEPAEE
jgi:hypothetical protein